MQYLIFNSKSSMRIEFEQTMISGEHPMSLDTDESSLQDHYQTH